MSEEPHTDPDQDIDLVRAAKDAAYFERNCLASLLAALFPSWRRPTDIEGWDEEWHGCVHIELPSGQISFHYHDSQSYLFVHVPEGTPEQKWDGHDKSESMQRILALAGWISRVGREATKLDAVIQIAERNYALRRAVQEAIDLLQKGLD